MSDLSLDVLTMYTKKQVSSNWIGNDIIHQRVASNNSSKRFQKHKMEYHDLRPDSDKSARHLGFSITVAVCNEVRSIGVEPRDNTREELSACSPVSRYSLVHPVPGWSRAYSGWWNVVLSITIGIVDDVCARRGVNELNASREPVASALPIAEYVGGASEREERAVAGRWWLTGTESATRHHGLRITVSVPERERSCCTAYDLGGVVSAVSVPVGLSSETSPAWPAG